MILVTRNRMANNNFRLLILPKIEHADEIVSNLPQDIELSKGSYKNISFHFKNDSVNIFHKNEDVKTFSTVWLFSYWNSRDVAYGVHLFLDNHAIPHTPVEYASSKLTDKITFVYNNIPTPFGFYLGSNDIVDHLDTIEEICGYPLIIKDVKGSKGKDSAFVKNRADLLTQFAQLPSHKRYLFQQYIPNDYDWGILVSNGKVVSGEKSYPKKGEFRNNACNGSTEVFVDVKDIPEEIKNIAIRASESLGLSWSRADIIVDKNTGKPYLLEVNRAPGITSGSSEVVGAQKFLTEYLESLSV